MGKLIYVVEDLKKDFKGSSLEKHFLNHKYKTKYVKDIFACLDKLTGQEVIIDSVNLIQSYKTNLSKGV